MIVFVLIVKYKDVRGFNSLHALLLTLAFTSFKHFRHSLHVVTPAECASAFQELVYRRTDSDTGKVLLLV